MGTKVQNLPGYYSMRDLNEESSSCGWPLFYGDKSLSNGQYYNSYLPSSATDACSGYDRDAVKRMMLEHEAVFKNQVYELHRLYRIQRDLMSEVKKKELDRNQIPIEASCSTGQMASQLTNDAGQKWHIPLGNSCGAKTSVSGVEGIHSPLDSMKGIGKQTSPFPSPNGCSSKDVEVLESRPSKVRRKMFDLHLPADEYIDTEESEKLSDEKTSDPSFFLPDRNCKNGKEGDGEHFCGNGEKTGNQEDTSRSEQSLRRRNGLADLNEPLQVEETYNSPYVHVLDRNPCQGEAECSDLYATPKQKSELFGLSREQLLNTNHGTDSWTQNNSYLENNRGGKGWYQSVPGAGKANINTQSGPHVLRLEKSPLSSQTIQDAFSKFHEPASDYINGRNKAADIWREKTVSDLHISERNHEYSINKHPESVIPLLRPGLFAAAPSSDFSKSWSHSASSWEMANSSLSQRLMLIQTPPCHASGALTRISQSQSNGILEECWPLNMNSKPSTGSRCDAPLQNGFFPGSSSGSKEPSMNISSISYDYLNHKNDFKIIPDHFVNNVPSKSCKGSDSNCNNMKSGKDIDLNVLLPNGSSNNFFPQSGIVGIMDGEEKNEECHVALPWLRGKTTCKNGVQSSAGESGLFHAASLSNKDETGKGPSGQFMHNITSVLCSNDIEVRRTEVYESSRDKKILGVPIFEMPRISAKEFSSITSQSVSNHNPSDVKAVENKKKQIFDINLPCDAAAVELDKEAFTETAASKTRSPTKADSRNQIDLNLSMSEDEGSFTTIPSDNVKMKADIDLEAPVVLETEEDVLSAEKPLETSLQSLQVLKHSVEQPKDNELMTKAAEAIVVLSSLSFDEVDGVTSESLSECPKVDLLNWFADVVSSCKDNVEGNCDVSREKDAEDNDQRSSGGLDYFEAMTLNLPYTKEEDYMPKPLVPENFKVEETTTLLPTRTRKGPARRGRQRRDFQRDILPGLASLSRHEVTEDLQTFGGIMRGTGYSWNSGLTRRSSSRNGGGRGRRRTQVAPSPPTPVATNETSTPLIQQLNNIEIALEDRSLTGWGKTTRRPRRQRCPAGNPPLIQLT
ncbi:uncharacterized protein LOC124821284 [Vigna umbellata]|uniref:uncharacterized protein LOC124821284 n=1 Tax=Vigna umbellata TaxID=87088 RepID=UPI001F5F1950|nr:uncharacterized protein LOC124821284 [Vigna umbellata]